jgi:hypothetical protein
VTKPLPDEDLDRIEQRLSAALEIITPPWTPNLETNGGLGGSSFIAGGHELLDHEIYIDLNLEGKKSDPRDIKLDRIIDFLGHSAEDIANLIAEVRRLR